MTTVFNLNRYDKIVANDLSLNGTISTALGGLSQWEDSGSDIYFSSGNVGIGTTNTVNKLVISGGAIQLSPYASGSTNFAMYSEGDVFQLNSRNSSGGYNGIVGLNMDVNGNVGIGTASPDQKLHVNGRVQANGMVLGNLPRLGGTWAGLYHTRIHDDTYGVGYNTNAYCLMTGENGSLFLNCTTTTNGTAGIYFQANASTKMIVNSSGNVGIGTATPNAELHVHQSDTNQNTDIKLTHSTTGTGHGDGFDLVLERTSNNAYIIQRENANMIFRTNNTDIMTITGGGNVGIGTATPYAKLHVDGTYSAENIYMSYVRRWIIYYQVNSLVQGTAGTNAAMSASIYASGDIVTSNHLISSSIYATSDRRIKQNIVDINDNSALETLRLLKPKKYEYIDKLSKTQSTVWGFIAQEVAETLPYATHTGKNEIPNIYQVANVSNDNLLTFNTNIQLEYDASGSLVNDLLLYDASDNRIDVTIQEIVSTTELRIESETVLSNEVFVYGQRVNDFHYLDKPAIFTVGISALQEVDRQLQAEKAKTTTLETTVVSLESENATLKTQIADILQRLSNANI